MLDAASLTKWIGSHFLTCGRCGKPRAKARRDSGPCEHCGASVRWAQLWFTLDDGTALPAHEPYQPPPPKCKCKGCGLRMTFDGATIDEPVLCGAADFRKIAERCTGKNGRPLLCTGCLQSIFGRRRGWIRKARDKWHILAPALMFLEEYEMWKTAHDKGA